MHVAMGVEHFNKKKGGAEGYIWHFAKWLLERGHDVDVYTAHYDTELAGLNRVVVLDMRGVRGRSRAFRFAAAFAAALSGRRYDVVQGYNHVWPGDVLLLHGGVHVAFEQFNALSAPTPGARLIKRLVYRLQPKYRALRANEAMQFADEKRHFIAVSKRVADDMVHYYPSVTGRVHVLPLGLDGVPPEGWDRDRLRRAMRKKMSIAPNKTVYLFVSHNYRLKGLYALLDAYALLTKQAEAPTELWVAGRDKIPRFKAYARMRDVQNSVRFLGAVDELQEVYAAADVLVHPSFYDTFGGVCLEARACGLPVVLSDQCGALDVLAGDAGTFVVNIPGTADALAQVMRRAAHSEPPQYRPPTMQQHFEQVELLYSQLRKGDNE